MIGSGNLAEWAFAAAVRGNRVCNYSGFVAFTFTIHEWLSSAEEEAEQIWTRPWTNLKILYMFIRILSFGTQIFPIILSLLPFSTSLLSHSTLTCRLIVGFQGVASQILMMAVQIILIMRVDALYQKNVKLRLLLRALYLAEIAEMIVVLSIAMPKIEYGLNCLVTYFPTDFAAAFFMPSLGIDFVLFVLTMVKFYQAIREGWGREPVIYRFLKDGIWAFALPFTVTFVNFICMAFLPGPLSSIGYSWVIAIPAFAGCRLILNMSHLLKSHRSEGPSTYPDQDFMITTREDLWSQVPAAGSGRSVDAHEHRAGYEMEDSPRLRQQHDRRAQSDQRRNSTVKEKDSDFDADNASCNSCKGHKPCNRCTSLDSLT